MLSRKFNLRQGAAGIIKTEIFVTINMRSLGHKIKFTELYLIYSRRKYFSTEIRT